MPGSMPGWMGGAPREAPLENQSPQQIYLGAEALLTSGEPREAGEQFSEVERLYPYSEWAKRAMLMSAFAYHEGAPVRREPRRRRALPRVLPRRRRRALRPVPDRALLLRPDRRHRPRPDRRLRGAAGDARHHRALPRQRVRQVGADEVRARARPPRRQGDGGRPLLPQPRLLHRRDQPLPRGGRGLPDHHPHPRGAAPAGRGLPLARPRPRGADRGGDPRLQLPGLGLVRRQLRAADRPRACGRPTSATAG